jgi:hypothetical protein
MSLATMTPVHQQNFARRLKELGLNPTHVIPIIRTGDKKGPTCLSADPKISDFPAQKMTVSDLDELKRLFGIADADFQKGAIPEHHPVPPPWDPKLNGHMPQDLPATDNNNIVRAMVAYLWGDSSKVKSYKAIIEKHHLPMDIATFAVDTIVVSPGSPLQLGPGNSGSTIASITIEQGGQIVVVGDTHVTVQKMISQ